MSKLRYLIEAAARRGPRFVLDYVREVLLFDVRHRTRTAMRVPKEDLKRTGQQELDGGLYVASFTGVIRDLLESVREEVGALRFESMQFVDLGCGKGKALLVYSLEYRSTQSPRALGLENDRRLAELALRNLSTCGLETVAEVFAANAADVTSYAGPVDRELLVYFYNSFEGETLELTLDALAEYRHHVLYVDPVQESVLTRRGYEITRRVDHPYPARRWLIAKWTS